MGKSVEDMYSELLDMENIGSFLGMKGTGNDLDDEEVFITSKEEAKAKRESEDTFGRKPATKVDIDEEIHFTSYRKKRVHKYTESELAKIRESCERSIVHDYGEHDLFHQTDEERAKNDMLAELSIKLGSLKRTYRRVDQYIEAMRVVIEAWKTLEREGNYLHTQDEFFNMVGNEEIVSSRIWMPKLKRIDDYNIDQIIKYISNPDLDPTDLVHDSRTTGTYDPDSDFIEDRPEYQMYYDEYMMTSVTDEMREELDEYDIRLKADEYARGKIEEDDAMRLLSDDEAQYLVDYIDSPPDIRVHNIPRRYIKGYDTRNTFRKKKSKMSKADRAIQKDVHDMLIKLQNNPVNRDIDDYNRSYLITHGMFDTDKPPKDFWDDLRFTGSWADDAAVYLYDLAVREELMNTRIPNQRYLTYGDAQLNEFFKVAERNGLNVIELRRLMNMEGDSLTSKREATEKVKASKKMESQILQRLQKLNKDDKFKKLVEKSEKALNKFYAEQ